MRLMTRFVMTLLTVVFTVPLRAQSTTPPATPAVDARLAVPASTNPAIVPGNQAIDSTRTVAPEPRAVDRPVAAHYSVSRQPSAPTLARQRAGLGQPMAMMIVGGAALLAGSIIGDTPGNIIMIGGAVIGLIGLYEYLQ